MSEMQKPDPTRIDEIADGLYRIHTPLSVVPGGFTFNQYLLRDEQSLLFHTGPRALFPQLGEPMGHDHLRRVLVVVHCALLIRRPG